MRSDGSNHSSSDTASLLASEHTHGSKLDALSTPAKAPVGAAAGPAALAPYYTRHWICFCILGVINNFHFVIVLSSAYSLALSFNALHLIGVISWATVMLGMAARIANTVLLLHTSPYLRILGSCLVAAVGLVLLTLSTQLSFWLAIVAICLIGSYSALGENVVLGYLRHFSPTMTGAWGCGTGWSGVAGTLGYLLMYGVLQWSNEFIYMLCVPTILVHVVAFTYVHDTSKAHILAAEQLERADDGLPSPATAAAQQTWTQQFAHMWSVFLAVRSPALHLTLVYFLEYVCIVGFASASNPTVVDGSGGWWYDNAYEILSFCYQLGVLVSRSSISFVQVRRIELLSLAQTVNFVVWFAQAYFHFLPLPLQFALMVWVGLMGGGMYVNVFYLLQRSDAGAAVAVAKEDRELAINLVATTYYVGIIGSSVFEIILAATLLKH